MYICRKKIYNKPFLLHTDCGLGKKVLTHSSELKDNNYSSSRALKGLLETDKT